MISVVDREMRVIGETPRTGGRRWRKRGEITRATAGGGGGERGREGGGGGGAGGGGGGGGGWRGSD